MPVGIKSFISQRLIQARVARGLNAVKLANITNISTASISIYEKGSQKPQMEVLERIANALDMPIDFFFNEYLTLKPKQLFLK